MGVVLRLLGRRVQRPVSWVTTEPDGDTLRTRRCDIWLTIDNGDGTACCATTPTFGNVIQFDAKTNSASRLTTPSAVHRVGGLRAERCGHQRQRQLASSAANMPSATWARLACSTSTTATSRRTTTRPAIWASQWTLYGNYKFNDYHREGLHRRQQRTRRLLATTARTPSAVSVLTTTSAARPSRARSSRTTSGNATGDIGVRFSF